MPSLSYHIFSLWLTISIKNQRLIKLGPIPLHHRTIMAMFPRIFETSIFTEQQTVCPADLMLPGGRPPSHWQAPTPSHSLAGWQLQVANYTRPEAPPTTQATISGCPTYIMLDPQDQSPTWSNHSQPETPGPMVVSLVKVECVHSMNITFRDYLFRSRLVTISWTASR